MAARVAGLSGGHPFECPGKILVLGPQNWLESSDAALRQLAEAQYPIVSLMSPSAAVLAGLSSEKFLAVICIDMGDASVVQVERSAIEALYAEVAYWTCAIELSRLASRVVLAGPQPLNADDLQLLLHAMQPEAPRRTFLGQRAVPAESPCLPQLDEKRSSLIRGCVAPLRDSLVKGGEPVIIWEPSLFLDGDRIGESMPTLIEVAGRPRILCYGPYLPLPSGRWRVTALLGFSPDINRLPFLIELDAGGVVTRGYFQPEAGGLFAVSFVVAIRTYIERAEIRIISQESALEGQLALIKVEFQRYESAL